MKTEFIKIWRILSVKERWQLVRVSCCQIFSGLMDMAAVLSIAPFLSVAVNPEITRTNAWLAELQDWVNYSDESFLAFLGVISLGVLVLNQALRVGTAWYGEYVSHQIWWALARRMFRYYLNQPYLYSSDKLLITFQPFFNFWF